MCRSKSSQPIKISAMGDHYIVSKYEAQLNTWLGRCSQIEECYRIIYCFTIIQKGIPNIQQLAQILIQDPMFLFSMGFSERDSDDIGVAVQDLGVGYVHKRDFSRYNRFDQVKFAVKKSVESNRNHELCCQALQCVEIYIDNTTLDSSMESIDIQRKSRCQQVVDLDFVHILEKKIFQEHFENSAVLSSSCRVISLLATYNEECMVKFGDTIIFFLIVRAMQSYTADRRFAICSCSAIASLCGNKNNRFKFGTASACDVLCKVMKVHIKDTEVTEHASKAMEKLQIDLFENTTKLGISGANYLIAEALKIHFETSPTVVEKIFSAIICLCSDVENRNVLGKVIVEIFIQAMKMYSSNTNISELGCQVIPLLNLSISYNRDQLSAFGVGDVLKVLVNDCTKNFNLNMVNYASIAIFTLLNGSPQNRSKYAGISDDLSKILQQNSASLSPEVVKNINDAIGKLK